MIGDLIYDVGMSNGNDAAFYLRQGFRVLAVEANPERVAAGQERFADAIDQGRLTILGVGITETGQADRFWVNEHWSEWSSFDKDLAGRSGHPLHSIEVPCVRFDEILAEHGVPFYLKIDIEACDRFCLTALQPPDLPKYVSIESISTETIDRLADLGYTAFKVLDQASMLPVSAPPRGAYRRYLRMSRLLDRRSLSARLVVKAIGRSRLRARTLRHRRLGDWEFPWGSSGPFGEDTPGPWQSRQQVTACFEYYHQRRGTKGGSTELWVDLHARRDDL